MIRRSLLRVGAGAMVAMTLAGASAISASAHPSETTAVLVTVHDDTVDLELQIPIDRLAVATDIELDGSLDSVMANDEALDSYILEHLAVTDADGSLDLTLGQPCVETINGLPTLVVQVDAIPVAGTVEGDLTLDYIVVSERIATHDVYVSLVIDWSDGQVAEGEPAIVAVLNSDESTATLDRSDASWTTGMAATIGLGMSHIAEGTDHLLFLGTLLLVAPLLPIRSRVGWRWRDGRDLRSTLRRTALIVTAFTVGHAVSLALVSFGRVTLPITPVEVLVAASIIAAAIHAVKPVVPRGEIAIAALFGLVHGSAFATTILDLQLAAAATASAVLGFNIGLELAQLVAVALALPLIVVVSRTRAYPVVRGLLAVAAAAAAIAWIVAILTGSDSVLTPFFNAIAARPVVVYGPPPRWR